MKIVKLYTGADNHSHFLEIETAIASYQSLGHYSKAYSVNTIKFRNFDAGLVFDWHNAPEYQYIIYLSGSVEIEISHHKKRVFEAGKVLFAADITGKGHITRTLTQGSSIIITTNHDLV